VAVTRSTRAAPRPPHHSPPAALVPVFYFHRWTRQGDRNRLGEGLGRRGRPRRTRRTRAERGNHPAAAVPAAAGSTDPSWPTSPPRRSQPSYRTAQPGDEHGEDAGDDREEDDGKQPARVTSTAPLRSNAAREKRTTGAKRGAAITAGSVARLPLPLAAHGDHVSRGDVPQVDVRGRERDVAELLLDHVDGYALGDELGGVRVPQAVRIQAVAPPWRPALIDLGSVLLRLSGFY
jgi:hypothetical protein